MTSLNLFLIQLAVAEFAIAALLLYVFCGAFTEVESKGQRIRELEGQRHTALKERDRAIGERDEWRRAWEWLGERTIDLAIANKGIPRLKAENESLVASVNYWKNVTLTYDKRLAGYGMRESLGRRVREVWIEWAKRQPNPKPSWLVPYDELSEPDKEADRCIGSAIWGDCIAANIEAIATHQASNLRAKSA